MATLSSLVNALGAEPVGDRREQLAQLAADHAAHAAALLESAAAVAQGLTVPEDSPVPLHRVLPSVTAVVPADRLRISVTRRAARCPVPARHLRQVLINLLTNAARYAPSGSAIRLSARTGWHRLHLTVADQGQLTADLARALARSTPPADDRGLGLWTVRQLVGTLGGSVRARPLSPYGLAMELNLPRRSR
jgi:signal transduction histidine kinase